MWWMSDVYSATYVGQLPGPACHPWIGHPCQGVGEGLVVHENGKQAAVQHVPEVSDAGATCEKLPIKGRVLLLGSLQLLWEDSQWLPVLLPTTAAGVTRLHAWPRHSQSKIAPLLQWDGPGVLQKARPALLLRKQHPWPLTRVHLFCWKNVFA